MEIKKVKPYQLFSYVLIALLLLTYTIIRSNLVGFTHDESIVYSKIKVGNLTYFTANNQIIQTVLSYLFSKVFGFGEFFLRLPSVIGLIVYLFFIYRVFAEISKTGLSLLLSLPLLVLNPFMMDYFNLSRGYGLAMAFFTGGLFYNLKFQKEPSDLKYLKYAAICKACCVYSNWAFLTAVLALHIAFHPINFKKPAADLRRLFPVYLVEGILLLPAVIFIFKVGRAGGLYYGGVNNVFSDTLYSVIDISYHTSVFNLTFLVSTLCILLLAGGMLIRKNPAMTSMKILIASLLLLPTFLHLMTGMKFPIGRAALYWPIALGLFVFMMSDWMVLEWKSGGKGKAALLAGFCACILLNLCCLVNFVTTANVTHSVTWPEDEYNRQVLELIDKEVSKNKSYTLGVSWTFEPSLNYYRETKNYGWLKPVTRDSVNRDYDFYYVTGNDLKDVNMNCFTTLKKFDHTNSFLLKSCLKEHASSD